MRTTEGQSVDLCENIKKLEEGSLSLIIRDNNTSKSK